MEKKPPYIERRVNEVDWYNSQRDQDFETLVNYTQNEANTPDKEANPLLEMAKGKGNQSPADIRSVLSTTVKPGSVDKPRVSFSDPNILSKLDDKVTIIDGNKYLKKMSLTTSPCMKIALINLPYLIGEQTEEFVVLI